MEVLNNAIDIYVPLTSSSGCNKKMKWSDQKCSRSVKLKNKAVKAVRNAKLKFEKKLAKQVKEDSNSFFAYVRSNLKPGKK